MLIFEPPDPLFLYGLFIALGEVVNKTNISFIVIMCTCCMVADADANCSPGYAAIVNSVGDTVISPMGGLCEPGYRLQDVPDGISSANGYSRDVDIPLCDGYWSGTTCNSRNSPDCQSGQVGIRYDYVVMAPMVGRCEPGYQLREMNDGLVINNGFVTDTEIPLVTVSYDQGECPDGYFDLSVADDSFFKINTSGECSGGYKYITTQCKTTMPDSPMICGILCEYGLNYTDVGTCAALCGGPYKTLRTSTGLIYPMYATQSVTPSLNVRVGDTVCHVNLQSGTESGSINIKYNNKPYHAVK